MAPHLQTGKVKQEWCAAKVFSCTQIAHLPADKRLRPFILARMYGEREGEELDEVGPQEMARRWVKRFQDTFSACTDRIDAVEVFNEISGDGNLDRQRNVAKASLIIAQYLVENGIRPVVLNYPVGAPTIRDAQLPEVGELVRYISQNDGGVGVHLYFDCDGYVPETWNFVQAHRAANYPSSLTYIATEAGVCRKHPWGWDPYDGWRECPSLTTDRYVGMLKGLFAEAKRKGVILRGVFVFTISDPSQGWESFDAKELFP